MNKEQRLGISCTFQENAIRAISREAHNRGILTARAVRDSRLVPNVASILAKCPGVPDSIGVAGRRLLNRWETGLLPEDVPIAIESDLVRIIGGRRRTFLTHSWGNATWKEIFARRASKVDFLNADSILAMPGSALEVFEANAERNLIFHAIDVHPASANTALDSCYGSKKARAEQYPMSFVNRISKELELSNRVLVPGSLVEKQMMESGVTAKKIITVPYAVDSKIFSEGSPMHANDLSAPLRAVCTGQISLRKGIPFLLEAVKNQNIELTLVGQVFDNRIIRDLPRNVSIAGVLTPSQLADLYQQMDVFVLPSIIDAFPLAVLEAVAAGLPVVTTNAVGSSEVLSKRHIVVDPGDSRVLREALNSMSKLDKVSRGEVTRELIEADLGSWERYADQVLNKTLF